jgi:photosystem II stability/assembly factor-like uncharacterized protein
VRSIAGLAIVALAPPLLGQQPTLAEQTSGVTAVLQAISPVNDSVVWVTGHEGVILRTVNGGRAWERLPAPGGDSLQFRDVYARSADTAFVLSAGPGPLSRIYRTTDGSATWQRQFINRDSSAFYDCFDFWDARIGIVVSDAVDGHLVLRATSDGGARWDQLPAAATPAAQPGEGAFAASGTCLVVGSPHLAWVGTGAAGEGKVYRSTDGGRTWAVARLPFGHGSPSAGVMTLAFRDAWHGTALGGDIGAPDSSEGTVALTTDGGRTWTRGGRLLFAGPVYGSAYVRASRPALLVAVGPKGLAISRDDGRSWTLLSREDYWAVAFAGAGVGWAVGAHGRISRLDLHD